ncbi:hypothetical protein [Streptomyces sp. NPDC057382]|uniref:hypothetical protein n=1 Tax=unclassified Streptomyces TaxID=2593676 RepID=UPI00363417A2
MTTHGDEPGPADPTDRELTRHHQAFTAKIEAALDVEAGLLDILFQSRHKAFTVKVQTALDVEAGLCDILMPTTIQALPSMPPAVAPPDVNTAPGGSRWQASPAQRLKLRSNPRVAAASCVLRVVGNWASTSSLARDRDLDLARAFDVDLDRERVFDLDLDRDRDLALALDLARALARALDLARALARARDLTRALVLARDLASALGIPDHLALALDLDRDLAFDLNLARALDLVFELDRDLASDRHCGRAHGLARDLARDLDLVLARARYWCLQIINYEYTQAVGAPVTVDEESLASLLDDFTTDDLSNADVREDDIELTGVRWSDGTTWPASTDIYRLKRRSDRQEDGSWIIRAGTGDVRENILT